MRTRRHLQIGDSFFRQAPAMRREFEARLKSQKGDRFVWDYWYIEDQYRLLRTPAHDFFSKNLYLSWYRSVQNYGRNILGCHDLSPVWLSLYIENMGQELHSDVPHGPWAFVHSLSPFKLKQRAPFKGGETIILKPEVLNFWAKSDPGRGHELGQLTERVASPFNRLTVFDPRFPHGVTTLKGTQDPLEGRLVLHGWFVNPRPYLMGAHSVKAFAKNTDLFCEAFVGVLQSQLELNETAVGTVSVRLAVLPSGRVNRFALLSRSVRTNRSKDVSDHELNRCVEFACRELDFGKARGPSQVVIPMLLR